VKFHDGTPMTSKDVIYTLSRLVDQKVGAALRSRLQGSYAGMVDLAVTFAESVKAAGIRVTVNQWPAPTYWDRVWIKYPTYVDYNNRRNAHDALDLVFANRTPYAAGVNFDEDGKLREFIDKALVETDPAKQTEMYKRALRRVALESGVIIPCFLSRNCTLGKNVKGQLFEWEMQASYFLLSKDA
jgi:peptide/nickel transport system substrate-binding protein